jgi:hypothetical protein
VTILQSLGENLLRFIKGWTVKPQISNDNFLDRFTSTKETGTMHYINIKEMEFKNNTFEPIVIDYMNFTNKPSNEEFANLCKQIIDKYKNSNKDLDIVQTPMSETQTVCIFYKTDGTSKIDRLVIIYLSDTKEILQPKEYVSDGKPDYKRFVEDMFKNHSSLLSDNTKRLLLAQYIASIIDTEQIKDMIKLSDDLK